MFAFGLSWVFTTLGLLLRSPNAVMNAGFMGIFPLTFLSNVFVDPKTLPSALEAFVDVNPISILATASRGLMEGNADGGDIAIVLGVAVGAHRGLHADHDAPVPQPRLDQRLGLDGLAAARLEALGHRVRVDRREHARALGVAERGEVLGRRRGVIGRAPQPHVGAEAQPVRARLVLVGRPTLPALTTPTADRVTVELQVGVAATTSGAQPRARIRSGARRAWRVVRNLVSLQRRGVAEQDVAEAGYGHVAPV